MPQVTLQEQLKRQKKMGERTTKFATEINKEVASASEENCAKILVASSQQAPRNRRLMG
jgi:hypothetical protein